MGVFDIDPCTFNFLFIAKDLYDYDLLDKVVDTCGNMEVCDDYYSLAWEGISNVFETVRGSYNEERQEETLVFRDPVITEFYHLCSVYEEQKGVSKEDNPFRQDGERQVYQSLSMSAYDYDARTCEGIRGGPRLVFWSGEEFCGTEELPASLAEARYAYKTYCDRLKEAIAKEQAETSAQEIMKKEAA